MPLNLLADPWIPVIRESGADIIRPDQIAEPGVKALNWPRPDLNLACMELLIGLVYLAAPPQDTTDWRARKPDAGALRAALAPLALAFNLTATARCSCRICSRCRVSRVLRTCCSSIRRGHQPRARMPT